MGPPAKPARPSNGTAPEFAISALEKKDVQGLLELQDLFAQEHLDFTGGIYKGVTLRDWQLALLCPERVLGKKGGREDHIVRMVDGADECFRGLSILKASAKVEGRAKPVFAGYIMFQVHQPDKKKPKGKAPHYLRRRRASAWVQVMQVFVRRELRHHGCGKLLFGSMLDALEPDEREDIRLSVLDMNETATKWYRSQGFVVISLIKDLLGKPDDANVIIYQEMQRLLGATPETMEVPNIFKGEVIQEEIRIHYPDDGGVYDVRLVGYDPKCRFHFTDSKGLSLWDGEHFYDTINLNEFYRDGRIQFKRHLSLILRDVEVTNRLLRQQKAEERAERIAKREASPEADILSFKRRRAAPKG